jgi:hypothetical protein
MTSTHAFTRNGFHSSDLDPHQDPLARIRRNLTLLDGDEMYAYSLWKLPEGAKWRDGLPADWPHEYMQSAGSAEAMNIEIRQIEDGAANQYAVTRSAARSSDPEQSIVFGPKRRELRIPSSEVFTADEAFPVYKQYYASGVVPEGFALRPLDLTYPNSGDEQ